MTIDIESVKEFGIGTWLGYASYKLYMAGVTSIDGLISGFHGMVQFLAGVTLCTVLALLFVSFLVFGMYFMFIGLANIVKKE